MSVTLLASGDHHFQDGPRWDECQRVHSHVAALVHDLKPNAFLSAGDIYDRASTPTERQSVAAWLQTITDVCPVIIAKGNHDRPWDLAILERLKTRHPLIVVERAGVYDVGGILVAAVAWPNRSTVAAAVGRELPSSAVDDVVRDALRNVLRGLGDDLSRLAVGRPTVLLGHFMIDGAQTGAGQPLIGKPMSVSLADLSLARADIVIAGHIHKAQNWSFGGAPILYTGSPYRTDFGEMEEKSIVRAEWNHGCVSWDRIKMPARKMRHFEAAYREGRFEIGSLPYGEDGDFRIRYSVASDQRPAARAAVSDLKEKLLASGAASVQVEERVIATTRARAPDVTAAKTTAEKLSVMWKAKGVDIGARGAGLTSKLAEIETEVA